ncbi:MAG: hypothetical protein J7K83_02535 [Candidatus Aenigmarchaeota archaeon]|nr:hypothetical protein [Candidatus Aenigmarchaeota archaeon]
MKERLEDLYSERVVNEIKKYVLDLNEYYENRGINAASTKDVENLYLSKDVADVINEFDIDMFEETRTLISEFYEIMSMMGSAEEAIKAAKTVKQYSFDKSTAVKLSVYLMSLSQIDDDVFRNALEIYSDEFMIKALKKYDTRAREFFIFEVFNSLKETGSPKFAKKLRIIMCAYSDEPLYGYPIMVKYSSIFEAALSKHKSPINRNELSGDMTYNNVNSDEWKVICYLGEVLMDKHYDKKSALEIVTKVYDYVMEHGFSAERVKNIIKGEVVKM